MVRRFVKDESGMTMGLTVIMVLLISVMGAGLLTFVMKDLQAVVEVNRGQKALDIAEAGVQVAKSHLRVDSFRQHYDMDGANDCDPLTSGPRVGTENWSKATASWTTVNCVSGTAVTRAASAVGVTKNFAGGKFHVTIECFDQAGDATGTGDPCNGGAGPPPDATGANSPASEKKFFKITSTGWDTITEDGAKRKIEAVYTTAKRTYAPIAFWTPKNIDFNGSTTVRKMSFFAGGNITNVSNVAPDTSFPAIYEHWDIPPYNTTRRYKPDGITPYVTPGFGAVGRICGSTKCTSDADSVTDPSTAGWRDYDSTTGTKGQKKKFVATVTDPANQITFPFDEGNALTDPSSLVDKGLLEEMRAAAAEQGNYKDATSKVTISTWPAQGAVYFVDFKGVPSTTNEVEFKINSAGKPLPRGVLIVRNGNFSFSNAFAKNGFEGVIIVVGDGSTTGQYTQTGGVQLDGYAAASGDMKFAGAIDPSTTIDYTNLNSFYDVKLWSWRELYQ